MLNNKGIGNVIGSFIGVMIGVIIGVSVLLPIMVDQATNLTYIGNASLPGDDTTGATGSTATIVNLLPVFTALAVLMMFVALITFKQ